MADFIFSRRARYPAHSPFSSSISDTISSVVRELLSSFSSVNGGYTQMCRSACSLRNPPLPNCAGVVWCRVAELRGAASTCIQLPAALREGLSLRAELRDVKVHGLQVRLPHIFELSLRDKQQPSLPTVCATESSEHLRWTDKPGRRNKSSACRRPSL